MARVIDIDAGSATRLRILNACEDWATVRRIRADACLIGISLASIVRALDDMTDDGALRRHARGKWLMYRATDGGLMEAIVSERQ